MTQAPKRDPQRNLRTLRHGAQLADVAPRRHDAAAAATTPGCDKPRAPFPKRGRPRARARALAMAVLERGSLPRGRRSCRPQSPRLFRRALRAGRSPPPRWPTPQPPTQPGGGRRRARALLPMSPPPVRGSSLLPAAGLLAAAAPPWGRGGREQGCLPSRGGA